MALNADTKRDGGAGPITMAALILADGPTFRWLAAHGGACVVHPGAKQCGYGQAYRQGYYRGICSSWTKRRGDPSTPMFCCLHRPHAQPDVRDPTPSVCRWESSTAGRSEKRDFASSRRALGRSPARPPDRRRFGVLAKLIQHLHDHLHQPRCSCDQPRVGSRHSTLSRWHPWRSDTRRPVGRSNQDDLCRSTTGQACTERIRSAFEIYRRRGSALVRLGTPSLVPRP